MKEVHSPKDSYKFVTLNKEFAFTNSVSQEVCFVCARQDLMLSEPLHCNTRPLLPSSETLGVKLSGLERLKSFQRVHSMFQVFPNFRRRKSLEEICSSQPPSFALGLEQGQDVTFPHWALNNKIYQSLHYIIKECTIGLKMFERYGVVRQKLGQPTR